MSGPSDKLQQAIAETIANLLDECGLEMIEQPLRLEGWLRDLYPDHRAAVSVTMECVQTGCHLESGSVQEGAARLALRAGVSPQWAEFGIRVWRRSLRGRNMNVLQVSAEQGMESGKTKNVTRTVEDILGQFRV